VNERFETSVPGVFAIGDVIPGPMLAHKRRRRPSRGVELMKGQAGHVNYEAIPNASTPGRSSRPSACPRRMRRSAAAEVATRDVPVHRQRAREVPRRHRRQREGGGRQDDRPRARRAHRGPRASDVIAEAVIAMEFGASAEDIARTVHATPPCPRPSRKRALGVAKRQINI
jgi:dihydrolipoamide dehydrogenase